MPSKNKPFVVYPDDTTAKQIEDLKEYFSQRQGGIKISDGKLGRDLINEKHTEIVHKTNNNARITTIVERIDSLEGTVDEKLTEMASVIKELVELIRSKS